MENLDVQQIGRYRLLDVIGKGGMGIVYRAIDTTIERKVAIKMLLGEGDQRDNDLLARFYREVRSTANLQHKNIVTVYALDDFDGLPYMVMEYLEGQSIAQLIAARQPLSIIEKIGLICQVCEGLQYAHERNVIHRDVKPANILVLKDGIAKIVDFGIARVGRSDNLTRTGQIVGSIYYMSPEQTTGVLDCRSDIYSTGVTLFEFLTGEVPFKGPDTQSTLLKIIHDPVPPLSRYISNCPKPLEGILSRAMAKDAAERYQTAEDFGYDLAQLQDTLKREMTDEFMAEAKTAIEDRSWDAARQKLQEILRLDRRNQTANELYKIVREQIQLQQRSQQIEQLKSQAEIALAGLQYEEALECIEQAKRLAPEDQELERVSRSIRTQLERTRELSEVLRRGQAALYAGDLSEAGRAVQRALELDNSNTEALSLDTFVRKEIEDRSRRAKLQGLLDEARREISARNFLSALKNLEKAQSIDPSDSNIRELLSWAASGHAQEKQRIELRRCTDEIGKMVAEDRYAEAAAACEAALQKFPDDAPLTKLYELARRQRDTLERRRNIDEISLAARSLIESEQIDEAIRLLESSLERFPADPNLEMLLEITQSHAEQSRKEQEERARQVSDLSLDVVSPIQKDNRQKIVAELLGSLENALSRRLPVLRMEPIALQLREAATGALENGPESPRIRLALSEYAARAKSWEGTRTELCALSRLVENATSISQTDSALERAHLLVAQYPRDEIIREDFAKIRRLSEQFKARREAVRVQILDLLRSMQSSHSIDEIQRNREHIWQVSADWTQDDLIRNLLDQVSACVDEALQRRTTVLKELSQLADSTFAAKSIGQLRFFKEQTKMLLAEIDDAEVTSKAADVERTANARIDRIESSIARLTDLHRKASSAPTFLTLKKFEQEALDLMKSDPEVEEAVDLGQRIQKLVEDRTREYKRIETSFEQLIRKSKDAGKAELEAIVGRQRILLQKYPSETSFQDLQHLLENAVEERCAYLKSSTTDLQIEPEDIEETAVWQAATAGAGTSRDLSQAISTKRVSFYYILAAATVITFVGGLLLFRYPRSVSVRSEPNATISVESQSCRTPCTLTLRPGEHKLMARENGYVDLDMSIRVPLFGSEPPSLTLREAASRNKETNAAPETVRSVGLAPDQAKIEVRTGLPETFVYADDRQVGKTNANGRLQFSTFPGNHRLRVEKTGYSGGDSQAILAQANELAIVHFAMKSSGKASETHDDFSVKPPVPATSIPGGKPQISQPASGAPQPAPVQASFIIIQAPAEAELHIDQQVIGHSAGGPIKAPVLPGPRTVEVFLQGFQPFSQVINVPTGGQPTLVVKLSPLPPPPASVTTSSPARSTSTISQQDRMAIQDLLNRYAAGYSERNLKVIESLWPSIPSDEVKTIKDFFKHSKSADMTIRLENAVPAGKRITVECTQTLKFNLDGKQQVHTQSKTIYVIDTNNGWLIDFIPTT